MSLLGMAFKIYFVVCRIKRRFHLPKSVSIESMNSLVWNTVIPLCIFLIAAQKNLVIPYIRNCALKLHLSTAMGCVMNS